MKIPFTITSSHNPDSCEIEILNLKKVTDTIRTVKDAQYNKVTKRWSLPRKYRKSLQKDLEEIAMCVDDCFDNVVDSVKGSDKDEDKENIEPKTYCVQMRKANEKLYVKVEPYNNDVVTFFKMCKNRMFDIVTKEWRFDLDAEKSIKQILANYPNVYIKDE